MATVRFSDTLKEDILANARKPYLQKRLEAERNLKPTHVVKEAWEAFIAPHYTKMQSLPSGFFLPDKNLSVKYSGDPSVGTILVNDEDLTYIRAPSGDVETQRFILKQSPHYHGSSPLLIKDIPENEDLFKPMVAYRQALLKINEDEDEFLKNIRKLMENFVTLAPALKQWPALWELIPDDVKERHKEVKETKRRKPKDINELGLDVDKMSSTVVAGKLLKK